MQQDVGWSFCFWIVLLQGFASYISIHFCISDVHLSLGLVLFGEVGKSWVLPLHQSLWLFCFEVDDASLEVLSAGHFSCLVFIQGVITPGQMSGLNQSWCHVGWAPTTPTLVYPGVPPQKIILQSDHSVLICAHRINFNRSSCVWWGRFGDQADGPMCFFNYLMVRYGPMILVDQPVVTSIPIYQRRSGIDWNESVAFRRACDHMDVARAWLSCIFLGWDCHMCFLHFLNDFVKVTEIWKPTWHGRSQVPYTDGMTP